MSSSTSTSPSKETIYNFISDIIEKTKSITTINETEEILNYDIIELTLLLKSIGFRLNSFEFNELQQKQLNGNGLANNEIEIEIKCKNSGLISKMQLGSLKKCTCPDKKSDDNNSFWEIQGVSKNAVQDTSCNLLPDISKKTSYFAVTVLKILLEHYKHDFQPIDSNSLPKLTLNEIYDRIQLKLKMNDVKSDIETAESSPDRIYMNGKHSASTPAINLVFPSSSSNTSPSETNSTTDNNDDKFRETESNKEINNNSELNIKNTTFGILNKEKDITKAITEAQNQLELALMIIKSTEDKSPKTLTKPLNSKKITPILKRPSSIKDSIKRLSIPLTTNKDSSKKPLNTSLKILPNANRRNSFDAKSESLKKPLNSSIKVSGTPADNRRNSFGGRVAITPIIPVDKKKIQEKNTSGNLPKKVYSLTSLTNSISKLKK